MNPEMMKGQIRSILIAVGGLVAGWFGAMGWFTTEQVTAVVNSPVVAALATIIVGCIWSALTHTEPNAVAVVSAIAKQPESPVKAVITKDSVSGHELAASIPGPTVVAAGTEAASIAAEK